MDPLAERLAALREAQEKESALWEQHLDEPLPEQREAAGPRCLGVRDLEALGYCYNEAFGRWVRWAPYAKDEDEEDVPPCP